MQTWETLTSGTSGSGGTFSRSEPGNAVGGEALVWRVSPTLSATAGNGPGAGYGAGRLQLVRRDGRLDPAPGAGPLGDPSAHQAVRAADPARPVQALPLGGSLKQTIL